MNVACRPIAVKEFLTKLGPESQWRWGAGLCVSGGPDSMALALLFSQVKKQFGYPEKLQAFIVDHQAREGSTDEAGVVADRLSQLGIPSQILRMESTPDTTPTVIKNFESLARIARYQLLAKAAISGRVNNLFLGHHHDDRLETLLMRLIRTSGTTLSALENIKPHSPIPCCHGMYGAFEGDPPPSWDLQLESEPVRLASRKISVSRPLLDFSKSQLLATCEANNVPYVIDETNLDPTSNLRSAVRYLSANYQLPRALQKPSLSEIRSRIEKRMQAIRIYDDSSIWKLVEIIEFDLRTGTLVVALPDKLDTLFKEPVNSAAWLLKNLFDAVTPHSRDESYISITAETLARMFPSLAVGSAYLGGQSPITPFTTSGLLVQPLGQSYLSDVQQSSWRLTRQPVRSEEQANLEMPLVAQTGSIEAGMWSEWLLWDNRFWIRLRMDHLARPSETFIREYRESDVVKVAENLKRCSQHALGYFKRTMREAAPGKERHTLPVIVDSEQVIAFPTLDILVPDRFGKTNVILKPKCTVPKKRWWEVRFKSQEQNLTAFIEKRLRLSNSKNDKHSQRLDYPASTSSKNSKDQR